jgi:patatin-related protein
MATTAAATQTRNDLAEVEYNQNNPAKTREIRVGLVMYGGVSLAVYINGVTHEFFRAVHGNGVYKLLKRLVDADIVVDIISGTSAGGINGIFLGYALANGRDFSDVSQLWRSHGDISKLLRDPDTLPIPCLSALDSDGFYHERLKEAFATMRPFPRSAADEPSRTTEIDLFVTGTDVDGNIYTTFDDNGHAIDVKDHRAVFHLKHRHGRKTPFAPCRDTEDSEDPTHRALARLSRLTSCFPGAFQSVEVHDESWKDDADEAQAHAALREWGSLRRRTYFLDGGVLDNKPFSHTTREIYNRAAERPVERYLFYVEPDPERFTPKHQRNDATPDFLESAYAGTIGIPGYESIADDLKRIQQQNAHFDQYWTISRSVCERVLQGRDDDAPGKAVAETHRHARLQQLCRRAVRGILKEEAEPWLDVRDPRKKAKREAAKRLFAAFDEFPNHPDIARGDLTLRDFDVFYRTRRLDHLISQIYHRLSRARIDETPSLESHHNQSEKQLTALLGALNRARKLIGIIQHHMEWLVDKTPFDWSRDGSELWLEVLGMLRQLLHIDPQAPEQLPIPAVWSSSALNGKALDEIHWTLKSRACLIRDPDERGAVSDPGDGQCRSALVSCDQYVENLVRSFAATLDEASSKLLLGNWNRFPAIDTILFPFQLLSDVGELAEIKTVRISPADAQRQFSKRQIKDKLAGDDLGHFSGFFKRSWRSNDILWGRLDGVCQLIECLISEERLNEILDDKEPAIGVRKRRAIRSRLVTGVPDPSVGDLEKMAQALLPSAPPAAVTKLAGWLDQILSCDTTVSRAARSEAAISEGIDLLVGMAQLEILQEELPEVYADQMEEAHSWGNSPSLHASVAADASAAAIRNVAAGEDPASHAKSLSPKWSQRQPSRSIWRNFVSRLRKPKGLEAAVPVNSPLGSFFVSRYRVGSETIQENIPPTVLLETIFSALLVVKAAVLSSIGRTRPAVRRLIEASYIFKFALDLPLRVGRALAVSVRREPRLAVVLLSAFSTAAIVALVAAVLFGKTLLYDKDGILWTHLLVLVVLPIITLTIISKVTMKQRLRLLVRWAAVLLILTGGLVWTKDATVVIRHKEWQWQYPAAAKRPTPPDALASMDK